VSTTYPNLTFALPSEETAVPCFDKKLAAAAYELLAGGPVEFKLATRVDASKLPREKRWVTLAHRLLPSSWFVPPALAAQRGIYDDWDLLLEDCKSPNDQILALPKNRALPADAKDVAVECRPRDKTDRKRFLTLQSVFGTFAPRFDPIKKVETKLSELERRLTALERAKGTRCASGSAV
jgi:hypothetical protein